MKRMAAVLIGAAASAPLVGFLLWKKTSHDIQQRLLETARVQGTGEASAGAGSVPEPVARFFARAFPPGQRPIRVARLRQEGEFFLNGAWHPMKADQIFAAAPPAFMWDARISAAPFLPVYVRDSYVGGRGSMHGAMLALVPVVNQSGAPELSSGALMRYLGEAVWFPTRLLPGNGLTWQPIDANTARATLRDADTTASLQFRFDAHGDIAEIYSPDRFREVNGAYVPTPWRVRPLGYETVGGMRLMSPAVAEWLLPEGPLPYWRARITQLQYEY